VRRGSNAIALSLAPNRIGGDVAATLREIERQKPALKYAIDLIMAAPPDAELAAVTVAAVDAALAPRPAAREAPVQAPGSRKRDRGTGPDVDEDEAEAGLRGRPSARIAMEPDTRESSAPATSERETRKRGRDAGAGAGADADADADADAEAALRGRPFARTSE
jgi:hypothetical protein